MATRASALVILASFIVVLVSGAFAPGAAEPFPLADDALEQAALPPPPDGVRGLDLGAASSVGPADAQATGGGDTGAPAGPRGTTPGDPATGLEPDPGAVAESAGPVARPPDPGFPVVVNAQVQAVLARFIGSQRGIVGEWLNRSLRYLDMIQEVLRRHGLPEDLAFVAMVESGFNPLAVSRAGAKGLWQFMADTARRYGLRVDPWVDERLDPEKSTVAAAAYLRDLYREFGSWALAKAAYNAGESVVARAIRAVGSRDFWRLAGSRFLGKETKAFVPAVHAATLIGRDPALWGFNTVEPPRVATETVVVPPATRLDALARRTGIPVETLRDLNPVLIRSVTPPGAGWELKVPVGSRHRVLTALGAAGGGRRGPDRRGAGTHVVQRGETVTAVARRHGVSVGDVLRWNNLGEGDVIYPGDRLRVSEARLPAGAGRRVSRR